MNAAKSPDAECWLAALRGEMGVSPLIEAARPPCDEFLSPFLVHHRPHNLAKRRLQSTQNRAANV